MGFSKTVKEEVFVKCARHCCVCHKSAGLNIEVHHIIPQKQGGNDSIENAIALCFDCHADAGHYFAGHPKGSKLSPSELRKHKEEWFNLVKSNNIKPLEGNTVRLIVNGEKFSNKFKPIFVRERVAFVDKEAYHKIYELTGKNPMEFINERKKQNIWNSPFYIPGLNNIESLDQYLDFISSNKYELDDENTNTNCQPIEYGLSSLRSTEYKEVNYSNCVLNINIKNISSRILENYKLYLTFENVVEVDSVNKRTKYFDSNEYNYNVIFFEKYKAEFIPDSNVLVQNDSVRIDSICFRVKHDERIVKLKWELYAKDIQDVGELEFQIAPEFEEEERTNFVNSNQVTEEITRILPKIELE